MHDPTPIATAAPPAPSSRLDRGPRRGPPAAARRPRTPASLCLVALALAAGPALAQQGDGTRVPIVAHVEKPAKVDATPERIAQLRLPPGFGIAVFAEGLGNTRILAVAPDGAIYVTRREEADVLLLTDRDGDGRSDAAPVKVASRPGTHGIAVTADKLYLVTVRELLVAPRQPDGRLGAFTTLVDDLPDGGQHPNRTVQVGPDGMLYVSVGSTCNACNETNPESATLLRITPDGKRRTIVASGLRNTIGYGWHPATGELWGMDHGIDYLGDDAQPEELNLLRQGRCYGWPHVWGRDGLNPQSTPQGRITKDEWRAMCEPMAMGYTAHAAPMQMVFYGGTNFPAAYRQQAYVAMRGSWNRKPASGYEIVQVQFDAAGQPRRIAPFVSGFLVDGGRNHFARPVGLAVARDGALLMADDANGVIYRIAYRTPEPATAAPASPPEANPPAPMLAQAMQGLGRPLALQREGLRGAGTLTVSAPGFAPGGSIPERHSEYGDGVSPELAWTAVPGAASYLVVVEDGDARPYHPVLHWLAWNIPATTTRLPEGLPEQWRLTEPAGLAQGATTRGSPGWYGPKPPVGDPPHRYRFQVFALDRRLELPPNADLETVLAAARGHVLGQGERVGSFGKAAPP